MADLEVNKKPISIVQRLAGVGVQGNSVSAWEAREASAVEARGPRRRTMTVLLGGLPSRPLLVSFGEIADAAAISGRRISHHFFGTSPLSGRASMTVARAMTAIADYGLVSAEDVILAFGTSQRGRGPVKRGPQALAREYRAVEKRRLRAGKRKSLDAHSLSAIRSSARSL